MKVNHRVLVMREAIAKIVGMLADKNIRVTQRGTKAFVEYHPKTQAVIRVNLPYIPDDASEELMNAVQGYLDHEVAHVLFTDPKVIAKADASKLGQLHNIIEDSWIEREMVKRFPGSAYNLRNVGEFFLKEITTPGIAKNPKGALSYLLVPAIRAWAGQQVFIDYMADKWHLIDSFVKKVGEDMPKMIAACKSSSDCLKAAEEIHRRLREAEPGGEKDTSEGGTGSESGVSSKRGGEGAGEGEGEGEPSPDLSDPDEPEDHGEGDDVSDDDLDGSEGEGGAAGDDGSEEPKSAKRTRRDEGVTSESKDSHALPNPEAEKLEKEIEESTGFDGGVADALTEKAGIAAATTDYLVYTKDYDVCEPADLGPARPDQVKWLRNTVDNMVGSLKKQIERMMAARSQAVYTGGHRSGRLHAAGLHRMVFGRDDVFRRKHMNTTKDTACLLALDCSGSMSAGRIEIATAAAYAVSQTLDFCNIKNEVIGFTTKPLPSDVFREMKEDPAANQFARYEALYLPIFKGFDERMGTVHIDRFARAAFHGVRMRENVDGESIQYMWHRLMRRREARKIMFVFSDGQPACPGGRDSYGALRNHLSAVVKQIEASGVAVIGIGIQSSAVKNYYKRAIVLDDINELPTRVMTELKILLQD